MSSCPECGKDQVDVYDCTVDHKAAYYALEERLKTVEDRAEAFFEARLAEATATFEQAKKTLIDYTVDSHQRLTKRADELRAEIATLTLARDNAITMRDEAVDQAAARRKRDRVFYGKLVSTCYEAIAHLHPEMQTIYRARLDAMLDENKDREKT